MEDMRIAELRTMATNEANYNKIWNEVEKMSKEIRGRKFSRTEQLSFNYKSINIVNLAIEILKEEIKTSNVESNEIKSKTNGYVTAKFRGFDAESGEVIEIGDSIQYVEGLGWVKADNY